MRSTHPSPPRRRKEGETALARFTALGVEGASRASLGRADVALFQGRRSDAIAELEKGVSANLADKNGDAAALKLVVLGEAQISAHKTAAALVSIDRAVAASREPSVLFPAARAYLAAGNEAKAQAIAADLSARRQPEPQLYGQLAVGEGHLHHGRAREALKSFQDAREIADAWLVHYELGRAYLELGAFAEAHAEFDACLKRPGEGVAIFLDDMPSSRYVPPVYYGLARAQEGLASPAAAAAYRTFLAMKSASEDDPMVVDARRRLGEVKP